MVYFLNEGSLYQSLYPGDINEKTALAVKGQGGRDDSLHPYG